MTPSFRHLLVAVALAAAAATGLAASAGSAATPSRAAGHTVIVRARPGREGAAESEIRKLGGTVGRRLRIIDGFAAALPAGAAAELRRSADVLSVTHDALLRPQSSSYSAGYDPGSDPYSLGAITRLTGARDWWNAGYTGQGIDVALIDSGVAPVEGLSDPGKLVNGPDLSLESQAANLTGLDTYGHGTFMAGLIAGRDAISGAYGDAPDSTYLGMAPDARVVSLKVATADGGVDVSQVIAAVDWVVQHAHDPGLNIRVLNLSYGTNATQSYAIDPLSYAAEQAWRHGVVVVTAGGNLGFQSHMNNAPALADPAFDPYVIAVGAADTNGTSTLADDLLPDFSPWPKRGATRGVDLLAPGVHLQGLRVPNSWIDANHPEGYVDDRYFRGSGTSEAAALVSGAAALVLQRYPGATPDQVKLLLGRAAQPIRTKSQAQGYGELQLPSPGAPLPDAGQTWLPSTGSGSLEASRGQDHLTRDGVVLSGEQDIFGSPFSSASMAAAEAAGSSWSGGVWNGNSWSGNSWSGNSWSGNSWSGNSWSGNSWSTGTWSGNTWSGNSWSGNSWSGNSWSGNSWSGGSWAAGGWG